MNYCSLCGCICSDYCFDCTLFDGDYVKYMHVYRGIDFEELPAPESTSLSESVRAPEEKVAV